MNYPFPYGVNSLLLNDRGEKFRDSEFILGVEPRREGPTAGVSACRGGGASAGAPTNVGPYRRARRYARHVGTIESLDERPD